MTDQRPSPIALPRVLLVEGPDDERVVKSICEACSDLPPFETISRGGIDPLLKSIGIDLKVDDREAVGILVDADDDPAARWEAIHNRLSPEFQLPAAPVAGGLVIGTEPRVGVWLMPDNNQPGELEDFVIRMIPDADPIWPLAQRYIAAIPAEHREFAEGKQQRAALHAWLSTRRHPRPMGTAITARFLETDGALCQQFAAWLRSLFG